jgi:hypothetical protein
LNALLALVAPLTAGALALALGADFNYDLRHYHFYNGYALVHGRFDYDFAPAGLQSFFNPLQDGLYYLGLRHLPPRLFGFLLGAAHGLNVVLVHAISRRALSGDPRVRVLALLAAVVAGLGSNMLSLLGTTTGDTLVSLPALLALLLALRGGRMSGLAAGLAAGAAAGLKLTMLAPASALMVALGFTNNRGGGTMLKQFAVGGVVGFLTTGGWWCGRLLERFANPVFPFLNGFFRSPFFRPDNVLDPRFRARFWWEALSLPLDMAMGWTSGLQEIRFREPRFLLVLVALLLWLLVRARKWTALGPTRLGSPARLVLIFWLVTYVLWVYGMHYYRYAAVLELLAPVVVLVLLRATPWGRVPVIAAFLLVAFVGSRPVSWGREAWSQDWFGVRLPALPRAAETLVIAAGERAAYVAPSFPETTRFVGLTRRGSPGLDGLIAERLAAHRGPFLLLQGVGATSSDAMRFGLAPVEPCQRIETRDGGLCLYTLIIESGGAAPHPLKPPLAPPK